MEPPRLYPHDARGAGRVGSIAFAVLAACISIFLVWQHVIPFFAFAPEIRKMIYTTNAVEALNRWLRKIIKTHGSFPTTRQR